MTRLRVVFALPALVLLLAACVPKPPSPPASSLKVLIAEPGLYRLTRGDLQSAGFQVGQENLARLCLTHKGAEIPIEVEQTAGDFAVLFYAAPDAHPYSPTDVYWLTLGDAPGARMPTRAVEPPRGAPALTFTWTLRLEQDRLYFSEPVSDAHWFWQSLTAPATATITASLPTLASGPAQMEIALGGVTSGEHWAQVLVNGQPAGEARWSGRSTYVHQASAPALHAGDNIITLRVPGEARRAEVDLLDSITLTYTSEFLAASDLLEFPGGTSSYRLRGFQAEKPMLYDITDPRHIQKLTGFKLEREGGATTAAFYDAFADRRYLALASARTPVELRPARPNNLRDTNQRADDIIIAPANFMPALDPLVKHRMAQGLQVRTVDVDQVYDAFSDGIPDPHALREFLSYARTKWTAPAPRFVLLVGKASYDYGDNLKGQNKNLAPTFLVPTPHLGEAASDDWFVAVSEDDPHPAMAIGRIPAETPTQVTTAVGKIIAYESASGADREAWRKRAVFVADAGKDQAVFESMSKSLAGALPEAIQPVEVFLSAHQGDVKSARAEIIREWNRGALMLMYIGHGSIDTWAPGPLFSAEHVGALQNEGRLPLLLTPTCLDGFFYHPEKDSLAEQLLFKSGGGIIAGIVPTGLSVPPPQEALMRGLLGELSASPAPALGEALMRAKRALPADFPEYREVIQTFVLLGDPALTIR